jgi:hypothetical protein
VAVAGWGKPGLAGESLWIEAEFLDGIRGTCWPMGRDDMKRTDGHWALSGPGWAAEWTQGGESGFLSIATSAGDDRAVAGKEIDVPQDGNWNVWVRYGDWREAAEPFEIVLSQDNRPAITLEFGRRAVVEEDNEMKLYWGWSFAWASKTAELASGPARLSLRSSSEAAHPRQVDVIALTTDTAYRPKSKERPAHPTWQVLDEYRHGGWSGLLPLARRQPAWELPDEWRLDTFRDRGFLYLWNVSHTNPVETWLGESPDRVRFPYNLIDADVRKAFEAAYGGRDDVPIYSDPRIVPTFHGVGGAIFATDPRSGEVLELGRRFAQWLDTHPDRAWATMMNYHPGAAIGPKGREAFARYRDRYVGSISGESLGYFYPDAEEMRKRTAQARNRRELVEAFTPLSLEKNREKYRQVYGLDLDLNPYHDVIPCQSSGSTAFIPISRLWGARTVGYESYAATAAAIGLRWAFLRGSARQFDGLTATYRSCNFGDSSTLFSDTASFHSPKNLLDNYYSVYSGAGMTWYKMDIWYQYMAGSSMFYHEQGFDEFWQPGGTTAAGLKPVQLSPKGRLVDRFLKVTAQHADRGHPYTPVAFLLDHAHGWEPSCFWPNSFGNWHRDQERFRYGDHEQMLAEYLFAAWHPLGPHSEKPITATSEVYPPAVFGEVFDVIFAYPDVGLWRTIDSYPVVIAAGDIELTLEEGRRLAAYVESGGTLVVAHSHLGGPGLAELRLPDVLPQEEAADYRWLDSDAREPSQRFRFHRIVLSNVGGRSLAATMDGKTFCASIDRGAGRLIFVSIPRGLGIDRRLHPIVARLYAHLTRGLMPIEVKGDVVWMVNRTGRGWVVTLLNPAGQVKPQQGIFPTDPSQARDVSLDVHVSASPVADWLMPDDPPTLEPAAEGRPAVIRCTVPAGGVRIIEIE